MDFGNYLNTCEESRKNFQEANNDGYCTENGFELSAYEWKLISDLQDTTKNIKTAAEDNHEFHMLMEDLGCYTKDYNEHIKDMEQVLDGTFKMSF